MPGVKEISHRREEEKSTQVSGGLELWLKDGDQAYVAIIPTGDEDDDKLGDVYLHGQNFVRDDGSKGFGDTLCGKMLDQPCDLCAEKRSTHQFAFWAYVYYVLHPQQDSDEWTPEKSGAGATRYKEAINGFRVFRRGFGQNDSLWNQLIDIYNEEGSLTKKVVRIGRRGAGFRDTVYSITATSHVAKLNKDVKEESESLPSIKEFYLERLGEKKSEETFESEAISESFDSDKDADDESLF